LESLSPNGLTVRRYDRDRFVAALFAAPDAREDLFTLYAFNLELARIRETVREPVLGQIRLQWWRDCLDRLWRGDQVGHPVADGLAALVRRHDLPRPPIDRLLDARELDMLDGRPADDAALRLYIEDSAGGLTALAARLLGGGDDATQEAARQVGLAWGRVGLMRAHAFHIKARRLYLPDSWMAAQAIDAEALLAGQSPPALTALAELWADEAAAALAAARALRREVAKSALAALLPARLADHYLAALAAARFDLTDRAWSTGAPRPLSLLWAFARRRF
jgi:phytoene synthase